jgi:hypothetical protein
MPCESAPEVLESTETLQTQGAMELESISFFTKRPVPDIKHAFGVPELLGISAFGRDERMPSTWQAT